MTAGCCAACVWTGAVVVVGRGLGMVTGVTALRAVEEVTGASVVVVVGAAVVVVVSGAAVVVVVGAAAASSMTAGCEGADATPPWERSFGESLWTAAVSNPTPRSIGMARVRSLRIFRPIRWGRP
jgi:hypothetical protein